MEKVKKIVLIGASGFVGSALLNEALNRGFEVTAVVRHPEKIKIQDINLYSGELNCNRKNKIAIKRMYNGLNLSLIICVDSSHCFFINNQL